MRKLGQHIVDRAFEEGLQGAEMPVSAKVWAGINSELEKDQLRRKVFFYRSIAAASILLLFGLSTWMFVFQGTQDRVWMSARKLKSQVQMPTFAELECIESNSPVLMTDGLTKPTRVRSKLNSNLNFAASSNEKVTTTDGNTIAIPDLKKVLEQIPKNTDMIRFAIMSRKPALSDPLSLRDHRSVQDVSAGAFSESNGGLSNLLSDKKKDKEYSFTAFESEDDEKPVGRWEVGAGFAPDMAFASTTPLGQGSRSTRGLADDPAQAQTNRLSPVVAYAGVLRASYEFDERFSLRAGLSCINRQSTTFASVNTFGKDATAYQSNLDLYSLEVPVSLKYNVIHAKNYDYYVTTGVSGSFFLHYDNYLQTADGSIAGRRSSGTDDILKPSQASLLLSTGLRYRLHDRLSMQLEPGLRYGVMRNEYAFSQRRPVSTSLLSGLSYHF
ncbi:MAG: PorT family protein [Bacteroidetes bacterium]|nr:PorT family protein [Bacteroidota bacterium]